MKEIVKETIEKALKDDQTKTKAASINLFI